MTIYVDELVLHPQAKAPFQNGACHLFADNLEELHAFAQKLGLKRIWFQQHPHLDHYDLTPNKRRLALVNGAREVDYRKLRHLMKPTLPRIERLAKATEDKS